MQHKAFSLRWRTTFEDNEMSKPAYSVNQAAHAFLKALYDYQIATRDMNASLQRLSGLLYDFSKPLKHIVQTTGSATTPASRLDARVCRAS